MRISDQPHQPLAFVVGMRTEGWDSASTLKICSNRITFIISQVPSMYLNLWLYCNHRRRSPPPSHHHHGGRFLWGGFQYPIQATAWQKRFHKHPSLTDPGFFPPLHPGAEFSSAAKLIFCSFNRFNSNQKLDSNKFSDNTIFCDPRKLRRGISISPVNTTVDDAIWCFFTGRCATNSLNFILNCH